MPADSDRVTEMVFYIIARTLVSQSHSRSRNQGESASAISKSQDTHHGIKKTVLPLRAIATCPRLPHRHVTSRSVICHNNHLLSTQYPLFENAHSSDFLELATTQHSPANGPWLHNSWAPKSRVTSQLEMRNQDRYTPSCLPSCPRDLR